MTPLPFFNGTAPYNFLPRTYTPTYSECPCFPAIPSLPPFFASSFFWLRGITRSGNRLPFPFSLAGCTARQTLFSAVEGLLRLTPFCICRPFHSVSCIFFFWCPVPSEFARLDDFSHVPLLCLLFFRNRCPTGQARSAFSLLLSVLVTPYVLICPVFVDQLVVAVYPPAFPRRTDFALPSLFFRLLFFVY